MARRSIPADVFERAKAMLAAGTPITKAAHELGVAPSTLWRAFGAQKPPKKGRPAVEESKLEAGRDLVIRGMSYKAAAEQVGVSASTLYRFATPASMGRATKASMKIREEQREKISRLIQSFHSVEEAAKMLGVNPTTMYAHLPVEAQGFDRRHAHDYWGFLAAALVFDIRGVLQSHAVWDPDVVASWALDRDAADLLREMADCPTSHLLRPDQADALAKIRKFLTPILRPPHIRKR